MSEWLQLSLQGVKGRSLFVMVNLMLAYYGFCFLLQFFLKLWSNSTLRSAPRSISAVKAYSCISVPWHSLVPSRHKRPFSCDGQTLPTTTENSPIAGERPAKPGVSEERRQGCSGRSSFIEGVIQCASKKPLGTGDSIRDCIISNISHGLACPLGKSACDIRPRNSSTGDATGQ